MDKVTVRIATPVKTTAGVLKPGSQEVDPEIAAELAEAGVLEVEDGSEAAAEDPGPQLLSVSQDEIDQLVAARAKAIAEEIVEAAVKEAMTGLEAERDAATARATDAEARLATLEAEARERAAGANPGTQDADAPKKGKAAPKG